MKYRVPKSEMEAVNSVSEAVEALIGINSGLQQESVFDSELLNLFSFITDRYVQLFSDIKQFGFINRDAVHILKSKSILFRLKADKPFGLDVLAIQIEQLDAIHHSEHYSLKGKLVILALVVNECLLDMLKEIENKWEVFDENTDGN